jgi:hypothetical protein
MREACNAAILAEREDFRAVVVLSLLSSREEELSEDEEVEAEEEVELRREASREGVREECL